MPLKLATFVLCFSLLVFACRKSVITNQTNQANQNLSFSERLFETKEPETFQAEIIFRSFDSSSEEKIEKRIFVARKGANRFIRFENNLAYLQRESAFFLIDYAKRMFTESRKRDEPSFEDSVFKFFTSEVLRRRFNSKIEKLNTEDTITRYVVTIDDSAKSEVILFYDEEKKIILKSEFYSVGAEKLLLYSVELQNLRFEVDDAIFSLPSEFKKVSLDEFARRS
ncbi:MAG: hypothetical protein NZM17_03020 [Pyrinomonadaceae bacterium]|nr:hypothetical protein [Pyrinomonadaceae bacterium]